MYIFSENIPKMFYIRISDAFRNRFEIQKRFGKKEYSFEKRAASECIRETAPLFYVQIRAKARKRLSSNIYKTVLFSLS